MAVDGLELQLASALQRFTTLQRSVETQQRDPGSLVKRALGELSIALEELRAAREQILENRRRMEELQAELAAQFDKYWELFDEMPDGYVVTRPDTTIAEVNRAASGLLNVSQRFLVGKALSVFVCEGRAQFLNDSDRLAHEKGTAELRIRVRPRERAPLIISARVRSDGQNLRWTLREAAPPAGTSN